MKTNIQTTKEPLFKLLALCGVMLVGTAAFACTKIPMRWFGTGTFDNPQKMGDTRLFLEGATAPTMLVYEANYDASCRTTAYTFSGTTSDGFNFSGTAVPARSTRKLSSLYSFSMAVTYVQVTDPVAGEVLATDNGGFKIDFASR